MSVRKPLRIVVLMHGSLVPPATAGAEEVRGGGVEDRVGRRPAPASWARSARRRSGRRSRADPAVDARTQADLFFNLLEGFDDVRIWDQNVVA